MDGGYNFLAKTAVGLGRNLKLDSDRVYFDSLADNYDSAVRGQLGSAEYSFRCKLTNPLRGLPDVECLLDIGVATGNNLPYLRNIYGEAQIFGVDLSSRMIARCSRAVVEGRISDVHLYVADGQQLPFADAAFDAVLHFGYINEYPSPASGISEALRVLRPGGRVVFSDDSVAPDRRRESWARRLIARNPSFGCDPPLKLIANNANVLSVSWVLGLYYVVVAEKAA